MPDGPRPHPPPTRRDEDERWRSGRSRMSWAEWNDLTRRREEMGDPPGGSKPTHPSRLRHPIAATHGAAWSSADSLHSRTENPTFEGGRSQAIPLSLSLSLSLPLSLSLSLALSLSLSPPPHPPPDECPALLTSWSPLEFARRFILLVLSERLKFHEDPSYSKAASAQHTGARHTSHAPVGQWPSRLHFLI